jgi:hypothetical protein
MDWPALIIMQIKLPGKLYGALKTERRRQDNLRTNEKLK